MQLRHDWPADVVLTDIDLYPAGFYDSAAPHAAWRKLRDKAPVWLQQAPSGTQFWSVTRYADVVSVLTDTESFSSEHSTMLTVLERDAASGRAIHLTDPPRHAAIRGPATDVLSMRCLRPRLDRARERVAALVDDMVSGGHTDFAAAVRILPMLVAGEILGVPEKSWPEAAHWTVASMAADDPLFGSGDAAATLMQAHVFLLTMFSDLIAGRQYTDETLIGALAQAAPGGQLLSDEEILVNCYAFIMGANPTVPQAASQLVLLAAEQPHTWQAIRSAPHLIGVTVEELLRWASPVNHLLRRTTRPLELHGHTIPAGGLVAAWLASANRDEREFPEPYTFDPARRPNPHVAFGIGPHVCIGNAAARVALRLLMEELAAKVERVELAGEVRQLRSNFLNGVTALPVRLICGQDPGHG